MANFHCAFQMIARQGGKSCVAALAYRSATNLLDQRTGEFWDYTRKGNVRHVDILTPDDAPKWVSDIAQECRSNRQSALQKYSDIIEAAEKRKDSQVYRECEFSLPNELTEEQNIEWADAFVKDVLVKRGMVAVVNFHFDIDSETGTEKPHCHVLLSTRHLTQEGWGLKNRDWNSKDLVQEAREQCSQYQNEALKKHGFDVQVTHLSYEGREIDIDAQPKLGANIFNMTRKGIETNTQKIFDAVRLKNQFKIVKDPEVVFEIVTSQHATFTGKDIAKVLNRYIDDADQFQILLHRLMASKELVVLHPKTRESKGRDPEALESTEEGKEEGTQKTTGGTKEGGKKETQGETQGEANRQEKEQVQEGEKSQQQFPQTREPVYTTKEMVRVELNLIKTAEAMALRKTHPVSERVINAVIAKYHKKFEEHGGLSADQEKAIRHMLSPEQISCVVGFAGAGKTTCLEAVREAFEEEGYAVLGLAPTGRAAQSIGSCGIRSMTVHRFLKSQTQGRERISKKTVVIMDEAGMLDSRRFSELETIVEKAGAKMIPMGDNNQAQAVEAGAPFRLITDRIEPAVLETVVRQQVDWQREAGRLFGTSRPRKALKMYQENGCFHGIEEEKPNLADSTKTIDNYCLARQISGHIWKEMEEDVKIEDTRVEDMHVEDTRVESNLPYFDAISQHQDYALHSYWKTLRYHFIQNIICDFGSHKAGLEARGININAFEKLVLAYKAAGSETNAGENREILFEWIENALRKMSYNTIVDTTIKARQALVEAWAADRKLFPDESHLMLAFTKENAHKLNGAARTFMREEGVITGHEVTYKTQSIEEDDFGVEHKVGHQRTFAKGDRILFTRNNKGLGVSNGTLGTIVFLKPGKIKVLLDDNGSGEEQKQLSFAPKLYPFFDNGWATTIRKSQSVTADHVKFLGTWEDYRNLAYVAITRHRRTLHLFYSDLDFWRPEKVIDRLSRIQEKLLGVDYLDAEKLQGHLKEDTDILWHHWHHKKAEQAIRQGKDFWAAIKVTAKDVLETIFPLEEKKLKEEEEPFLSLENSEEHRSRGFFKDLEAKEGDGRLPGEGRHPGESSSFGKGCYSDEGQFDEDFGSRDGEHYDGLFDSDDADGPFNPNTPSASHQGGRLGKGRPPENDYSLGATQTPAVSAIDLNRLKNQSKIMKNPEIIFEVVTAKHSTFTKKDIARTLNEHIDDPVLFQILYDRLSNSKELVNLEAPDGQEAVFTTQKMARIERSLVTHAQAFAMNKSHLVSPKIIERTVARFHKKFEERGGLSMDQDKAIRHMLSPEQISCVVGFAGAGKTTCLEAVKEAWMEAGYEVLGLAPTGKAERSISECGIPSMTVHKFLKDQEPVSTRRGMEKGRGAENDASEQKAALSSKTVLVIDEAGMVDSRRFKQVQDLVAKAGAKIVPMGDNNQLQSVDAGPAFRLVCDGAPPVVLETVVRQNIPWQREATRLFGMGQPRQALALYHQEGAFKTVTESMHNVTGPDRLIETFCLSRQVSGRIWKEIAEDYKAAFGAPINFGEEGIFDVLSKHQDFELHAEWKDRRKEAVEGIIQAFGRQRAKLEKLGVDIEKLDALVSAYQETPPEERSPIFGNIEKILRQMSYKNIVDTRADAKQALIAEWAADLEAEPLETASFEVVPLEVVPLERTPREVASRETAPERSHLMLAFTNRDARSLNESARGIMREKGRLLGPDYAFETKSIEKDDFGNARTILGTRTFAQGDRILFTLNSENLEVKNGSLGTILSLDQHTITVSLDGKDKKRLSFSPTGYPFLDNGWATNIHTAQSVTAEVVKLLGSFEQYRNLVYVAMTRHQTGIKVYVSDLDFWREEKVFDRLSRVQEKLSGFDYLDEMAMSAKLEAEGFMAQGDSHNAPLEEGILRETSPNPAFQKIPQKASKTDFLDESYLDLEDTEEKRSSDIFKDPFDSRGKEAFSEEGVEKRKGNDGRDTKKDITKGDMKRETQSRKGHWEEHKPSSSPQTSPTSSSSDNGFKEKLEAIKEKISRDYDVETLVKEKPLSFEEAERQLKERIVELATSILGEPDKGSRNTPFLRFGKDGKFAVGVRGEKQGIYINFTTWVKGGAIRLIEDQKGLSAKEALAWAKEWLGGNQVIVESRIVAKPLDQQEPTEANWKPIVPVPKEVKDPDIANNKYLNYMLKDGSKEISRHAYRDENGNLKGYVVRLEKPPIMQSDGTTKTAKLTPPLSYVEDARGFKYWKWKAFFGENDKTPYGMEKLRHDHSKPILIVEGEKTADAAQKALSTYHVLSWIGGAGSVGKTNWDCLIGKDVTIWPDYDYNRTGQEAAQKLQEIISGLNKAAGRGGAVSIVTLPEHLRHGLEAMKDGWDLADLLPKGWTVDTVAGLIQKARDDATQDDVVRGSEHKGGKKNQEEKRNNGEEKSREKDQEKSQDKHAVRTTKKRDVSSSTEPETKPSRQGPSQTSASEVSAKSPQPKDPLTKKREHFEKIRLPINQEFCATLGFLVHHKRLPRTAKELDAAYWQGERLTAIEGRLYKEALEGKQKNIDEKVLTTRARAELAENQTAPRHVTVFGKASGLTPSQLKQLQQHALFHQDKTNQSPTPSDLESICQAIKAHGRLMEADGGVKVEGSLDEARGHGTPFTKTPTKAPKESFNQDATQTPNPQQERPKTPEPSSSAVIYQSLMEQQALLRHIKDGSVKTIYKNGKMVLKDETISMLFKSLKVQDSCSERLGRMNSAIQSLKDYSKEMRVLDLSRQNQRGMDV
jgi:ATP-dependent exoDNAse (exonuclease V) alpha subunit